MLSSGSFSTGTDHIERRSEGLDRPQHPSTDDRADARRRFLRYQARIAVAVDLMWVAVFATHLYAVRRMSTADVTIGTVGTA